MRGGVHLFFLLVPLSGYLPVSENKFLNNGAI